MFSSILLLSLAAAAPLVHATVSINQPIASTVWNAGQQQTVTWIDSGAAPTLEQFGAATFELSVGTESTQVAVQTIGDADVSKVNSLTFTPDPNSLPPSYNSYFIKATSVNGLDNSTTAVAGAHYMAFSARFTINGGKGQFSSGAQAVIGGGNSTTTAATGSTSSTSPAANAAGPTTHASTSTSSAAKTSNTTAPKNSSNSNGVSHVVVPHVLNATGVAAIVFVFAFFF